MELTQIREKFAGVRSARPDQALGMWEAAVLLPLVQTEAGLSVLFEVRSQTLTWQPGDICFPGGRREASDATPELTAVRETCEELNLPEEAVEVLAPLPYFYTQSGIVLYPYLGTLLTGKSIKATQAEVGELFTIPLSVLLTMRPRQSAVNIASRPQTDFPYELVPGYKKDWRQLRKYDMYFYEYDRKVIWGMTARVLHNFLVQLKD